MWQDEQTTDNVSMCFTGDGDSYDPIYNKLEMSRKTNSDTITNI